jgi:tetratricopeptide (TPR) repeat protein
MDSIKRPFLFFYLFLASYLLLSFATCNAQNNKDSLMFYYNAILSPEKNTDLHNGIQYYLEKKERDFRNKDTLRVINDLRMIAIGQYEIGYNYESESSAVEALRLIDKMEHKDTLVDARFGLYVQLGNIYRTFNNSSKAIEVYNEALRVTFKTKDSISVLNNKANIYKDLKDYNIAIDLYSEVYKKCIRQGNKLLLAMALDNLGFVQSKINSPEAFENLNKALVIRYRENNLTGLYASYKSLVHYFLDRNNKEQASAYANRAYEVVKKLNSSAYTQDALSLFMALNGDPKVAEYKRLTDSITEARQLAENKNAFMKYNLEEERKKTEASRLQQEKEKRLKLWYQSVAAIVLVLMIASFIVFQDRYKRGKIEQMHKTETRISKKVHDEVANDVYHIMTKLQSSPMVNEEVMDDLEDIYVKTRDISKENSALNVKEGFEELLNDLLVSYKGDSVNVITRNLSKIDWNSISELKKTSVYRVLQELMTNMKKHSEASLVALTFERVKKKIVIKYSDNGVGCKVVKNSGLLNVENRIVSLNGTITFESELNKGFKVKITI